MAKVLLVYANPAITATPVPPYGMERVAHAFRWSGCQVRMEAPFIEEDPAAALLAALAWGPDLVGFSVRNLDDALVVRGTDGATDIDTTGYLDPVRPLVQAAVGVVGAERVVLGGTGLSAAPEAVLADLGAGWAITGPADDLCFRVGRSLLKGALEIPEDARVLRAGQAPPPRGRGLGDGWKPAPGPTPRMGPYLGLAMARGGRVAVQIAAGCDRRCVFCVESAYLGRRVVPRPVDDVVAEVDALRRAGIRRFWLATSELNVPDDRHAIAILKRLAPMKLDLQAFLQVAPVSDALLDAMEDAGMDPTALSFEFGHLDDALLRAGAGPANRKAIDRLVETWLRRGHRQLGGSVLLGAHWLEDDASIDRAVAAALEIDSALPDGLGLAYACGGRVYPESALGRWVREHGQAARPDLYGAVDDASFAQPVVYCRPGAPRALLARVQAALAGARGPMRPMNAEAPADPRRLEAEALVNRGVWRLHQDEEEAAERALSQALERVPDHLEALKELALLRANRLGDRDGAVDVLRRLAVALPAGDGRHIEVLAALRALGA